MKKKMIFTGIVLSFCASFLFAQTATPPSVGDGSESNPYQIASLVNLGWLSENSDMWASSIYFIQTADIDASGTQYWSDSTGFSPIGNNNSGFKGNYNGDGHTISGLYINRPSDEYISLFGKIETDAKITALGLTYVDITGGRHTGGLAGLNRGIILECYASGAVSGSRNTGGLIGYSSSGSNVLNCYSNVSVIGSEYNAGGLTSVVYESVISNCYASGLVSGGETQKGAFIGWLNCGTINACFWDQTVNFRLAGVGVGPSSEIVGKTTAEMQTQSTYTDSGWNFIDTWMIDPEQNDGYPILKWQIYGVGIDNKEIIPETSLLDQNYPNPFNPTTTISYQLSETSDVQLMIYDISGRKIKTMINTHQSAGSHAISWDASALNSGVYIYSLRAGGFVDTKKMVFIK